MQILRCGGDHGLGHLGVVSGGSPSQLYIGVKRLAKCPCAPSGPGSGSFNAGLV